MKTDELREKYLEFFESLGHTRCHSDVLVPTWDPSVLFTPAGMNQFKDHFLGRVKLDFTRATSCQKCLRTGDIENVGRTAYHHTFFEMLGNFSFGDYFKQEAIRWAWEFCTSRQWLGIDPERLSVTVYDDDDQAATVWHEEIGLPTSRIERMGEADNFWPAHAPSKGPDGVCGPCSEIFYRDDFGDTVEIWNLVFTQFHRVGDPPDNLRPLPSRNIDTGMGLERTAATLQGVETNYHIDILRPIVEAAAEICGLTYDSEAESGRRLRRITDHVRACAFAIHENVYPGAKAEKYVVRRLLRRAVLDGRQLGVAEPFLHQLVPVIVQMMSRPYPELADTDQRVTQVIRQEEQAFFDTIDAGLARVEGIFANMRQQGRTMVDGGEAAELYSTYGIPPELVESMAAEQSYTFDTAGFRQAMEQHGIDSGKQQSELFKTGPIEALKRALHETVFVGYDAEQDSAHVRGIVAQNRLCDQLSELSDDQEVVLVLDRTPFYAESGGQVGDSGLILGDSMRFEVRDTQSDGDLILHYGHLREGTLSTGEEVTARVDENRRSAIRRAHSATHLLHSALQKTLGNHAQQQGSKVDDDWLRFDFTNLSAVTQEQLMEIESDVLGHIRQGAEVDSQYVPLAEARNRGAMMLFGEKYPDPVRLVSMGDASRELCGGTHVTNTRDVQEFEILAEESVATGTRRIVAVTGSRAAENAQQTRSALERTAQLLNVTIRRVPSAIKELVRSHRQLKKQVTSAGGQPESQPLTGEPTVNEAPDSYDQIRTALREGARTLNVTPFDVPERVSQVLAENAALQEQVRQLSEQGLVTADTLLDSARSCSGVVVIVSETPGANANMMRQLIDQVRKRTDASAILLAATPAKDKVLLVAGVSESLVKRGVNAGRWVKEVAQVVGGGGGGRPDMAQAGGKRPAKLPEALTLAQKCVEQMLQEADVQ